MATAEELIRILESDDEEQFESDEEMEIDEQVREDYNIIDWSSKISAPVVEEFNEFNLGLSPTVTLNAETPELVFFEHFCDEDLVSKIVNFTNKYHQNYIKHTDVGVSSRLYKWQDVSVDDIWIMLAVTMLFTRNKRLSTEEHWSTDPLLHSVIFHNTMSRNRYCTILAMLTFYDVNANAAESRLHRVKMMIDHARQKFKSTYNPGSKLRIGESIVPFKGRLSIKQYLAKKRNRFGIKLFVLCDVQTGFIIDFIVYCGSETDIQVIPNLGLTGSVVTELIKDYYYCNRELYLDICYSSPQLFLYLKQKGTYACGTVKPNRKGMPTFQKLKRGETAAYSSPPLLALKWQDKKAVTMLSTLHDDKIIPSEKLDNLTGLPKLKPHCVVDYTKNMGSVDKSDMMMSTLNFIEKSKKWHKKFAFHVFDMLLLNAFYTYKVVKNNRMTCFAAFQINVIRQIMEKYNRLIMDRTQPTPSRGITDPCRILPIDAVKHFTIRIPNRKSQRCKMCAAKSKTSYTRFMCKACNVYLCVDPCAADYHRSLN